MRRTLVVGLFDDEVAVRHVLRQLAESPLDLRDVSVLHRNGDVQRSLREEAGVPSDRTVPMAALLGALVGSVLGILASNMIPALGPALNAAVGGVLGAVIAVLGAVVTSPLKIPPEHRAGLAEAIDAGATVVIVRAEGAPTAEAIGDLFRASGARDLGYTLPAGPVQETAGTSSIVPGTPHAVGDGDGGLIDASIASVPEEDLFRPPGRRSPAPVGEDPT